MAILAQSNEYQEFKRFHTELKLRVRQWPRNDDSDLATCIPRLAEVLKNIVIAAHDLRELVEKTNGEEELNKCMEELSEGMDKLETLMSRCLEAMACTYHRLHGRDAPEWERIESMWPICGDDKGNLGVFKVVLSRIRYNDFIEPRDLQELGTVVDEIATAEKTLHYLVGEGVHIKDVYERNGRTLTDPDNQYHWDADDEGEQS